MRILHVAYIYPPRLEVADGITNVVYNVTKELAKRGHEVSVYTSNLLNLHEDDYLPAGHSVVNGVNVYYSRCVWRYKTFVVTPSIVSVLSKNIDRFDIIHIHDARSFQGISSYLLARLKKVPYVYQPHGSFLPSLRDSPSKAIAKFALDNLVSRKVLTGASKVVALSEEEAEQYRVAGVPESRVEVIPNGIDLSEYAHLPRRGSFRKRFSIDVDKKIVLFLGRIHRIKGVDILVKAFANIVEKLDDAKLVVAGPDDGFLVELESLIKTLRIEDNVLISGPLYGKDKIEAYVDADVYVLPSRYETFPMTVLEAVACRTPVLLTENCGTTDYFKHTVGTAVKSNPNALSEGLLDLLLDDEQTSLFRHNCRAVIERFSISKVASKLEEIYEKVAYD